MTSICQNCEIASATTFCISPKCAQAYCEKCFAFTHQSETKKKHTSVPVEKKESYLCSNHVKAYSCICDDCKTLVCYDCCLKDGHHFEHKVTLLTDKHVSEAVAQMRDKALRDGRQYQRVLNVTTDSLKKEFQEKTSKLQHVTSQCTIIKELISKNESFVTVLARYNFCKDVESDNFSQWKGIPKPLFTNDNQEPRLRENKGNKNQSGPRSRQSSRPNSNRGSRVDTKKQTWVNDEMTEIVKEYASIAEENDPDLVEIVLAKCKINDDHVSIICKSLLKNTNVTKLDFSNNLLIIGKSVDDVVRLIVQTGSLQELLFSGCPIDHKIVEKLKFAAKANTSLVQVHFGSNQTEQDFQELEVMMESNFEKITKRLEMTN